MPSLTNASSEEQQNQSGLALVHRRCRGERTSYLVVFVLGNSCPACDELNGVLVFVDKEEGSGCPEGNSSAVNEALALSYLEFALCSFGPRVNQLWSCHRLSVFGPHLGWDEFKPDVAEEITSPWGQGKDLALLAI